MFNNYLNQFLCKTFGEDEPFVPIFDKTKLQNPNLTRKDFEFLQADNDGKLGKGARSYTQHAKFRKSNE